MAVRILQLTDLHLFADPDARLKGIPTRETLRDVLEFAETHDGPYDLLVITGDLAHDELPESYRALRALLGERVARCRLIPGNHDNRRSLRDLFPEVVAAGQGPITFSLSAGGWQLIGLDTHVPGEVSGRIDTDQLAWLADQLSRSPQRPTLLFMHHPPIPVGVAWLDRIGLEDAEPFCRLIESSPQVRVISAGHVHHEFQGRLGQASVLTTPSTGLQFLPAGEESAWTTDPPGYRFFTLTDDRYETQVVRLPELKYAPCD